jgi:hypothetical protein
VTRSAGVPSPRALCIAWLILDEHGDTYDHVPPPPAPPDPSASVGRFGCTFNRSGVRVPTLAISAWISERTVVTDEHGALLQHQARDSQIGYPARHPRAARRRTSGTLGRIGPAQCSTGTARS